MPLVPIATGAGAAILYIWEFGFNGSGTDFIGQLIFTVELDS